MQKQETEIELFMDSLKSEQTRIKYSAYLKKYLEITGVIVYDTNNSIINRH